MLYCLLVCVVSGCCLAQLQSNQLMWLPLLRDHLSKAATFSGSLEPKISASEPVLRGHLS